MATAVKESPTSLKLKEKLMTSVVTKLYQVLCGGDNVAPPAADNFLTFCLPGIPFAPEDFDFAFKGLAGASPEESRLLLSKASDWARLANLVPDTSMIFSDKNLGKIYNQKDSGLMWEIYSDVLQFSQVANSELTADQKEKIERFRKLLWTTQKRENLFTGETEEVTVPGPMSALYDECMAEYLQAASDYNTVRISAMNSDDALSVQNWALNASNLRYMVKSAKDRWVAKGYKNEVEQINAYINQVTQRNLAQLKERLADNFDRGRVTDMTTGLDFYFTSLTPSGFARDSKGWTEFSFKEENTETYDKTATTNWDGRAKVRKGIVKIAANSKGSITKTYSKMDMSGFSLKFEVTQIPIIRPWMSIEFIKNTAWRFQEGLEMKELSNGEKPPEGRMTALPVTAIFARNLTVDFNELHDESSQINRDIKGGLDVSIGPFKLNGKSDYLSETKKTKTHLTEEGVKVDGLQLIGFKCVALPKSPNPSEEISDWI